jgi:hypothetical protein
MANCLIFPKLVTIGRLDTAATKLTAPGVNTSFRSMRSSNANDGSPRETPQQFVSIALEAQVETGQDKNARSTPLGNSPNSNMRLVFDRQDMVAAGLIHATTGDSLLKVGDRLESIAELDGTSLWTPRHGHTAHLRITMAEQTDFGFRLGSSTVVLHVEERPTGP